MKISWFKAKIWQLEVVLIRTNARDIQIIWGYSFLKLYSLLCHPQTDWKRYIYNYCPTSADETAQRETEIKLTVNTLETKLTHTHRHTHTLSETDTGLLLTSAHTLLFPLTKRRIHPAIPLIWELVSLSENALSKKKQQKPKKQGLAKSPWQADNGFTASCRSKVREQTTPSVPGRARLGNRRCQPGLSVAVNMEGETWQEGLDQCYFLWLAHMLMWFSIQSLKVEKNIFLLAILSGRNVSNITAECLSVV